MEENKITRLAVQRKNPKRVNVYLDGSFAFGLYRDTAAWLEVGQTLSDEKIKKLLDEDQKADVYVKATDFISYRPRTVFETRKKLEDEGFDETLAEKHLYRYEGLSKFECRKKLGNYLAGKGFSYDVISDVTQELWKNINASSQ